MSWPISVYLSFSPPARRSSASSRPPFRCILAARFWSPGFNSPPGSDDPPHLPSPVLGLPLVVFPHRNIRTPRLSFFFTRCRPSLALGERASFFPQSRFKLLPIFSLEVLGPPAFQRPRGDFPFESRSGCPRASCCGFNSTLYFCVRMFSELVPSR